MKIKASELRDKYGINNEFIHYGHSKFDLSKFNPILNRMYFNKPMGGLWASPVNSDYGWREWCIIEDFEVDKLKRSFRFKLSEDANVYVIDSFEDLDELPLMPSINETLILNLAPINFEELMESVDVVLLTNEGQSDTRYSDPGLYGWDCESILVMNPDIIEEIKPVQKGQKP